MTCDYSDQLITLVRMTAFFRRQISKEKACTPASLKFCFCEAQFAEGTSTIFVYHRHRRAAQKEYVPI